MVLYIHTSHSMLPAARTCQGSRRERTQATLTLRVPYVQSLCVHVPSDEFVVVMVIL